MPLTKQQILEEARSLSDEAREELIEELRQSAPGTDLTPEQYAELDRRIAAMDRGETTFVDGPTAMQDLFRSLRRRGQ